MYLYIDECGYMRIDMYAVIVFNNGHVNVVGSRLQRLHVVLLLFKDLDFNLDL